jgi:uncharacterized membrane protein
MYFTVNDRQAQAAVNSLSFNSEKSEKKDNPMTISSSSSKMTFTSYTVINACKNRQQINGEGGIGTQIRKGGFP